MSFLETLRPCPRCSPSEPLKPREGHFLEAICGRCLGRFLPIDAREALFADLQIDDNLLREMLESFVGDQLQCPGCGFKTRELQLRGRYAHFCRGCGGCWLDQGDLSRITKAQVREVGVTDRDPSLLPEVAKPDWEGRRPPAYGPWWRRLRWGLLGGWLTLLATVVGVSLAVPSMVKDLAYYLVTLSSAYLLWWLPTLFARRKKTLPRLFAFNAAALLCPPLWFWLLPRAIMAPGVEERDCTQKVITNAARRAVGTGAFDEPK